MGRSAWDSDSKLTHQLVVRLANSWADHRGISIILRTQANMSLRRVKAAVKVLLDLKSITLYGGDPAALEPIQRALEDKGCSCAVSQINRSPDT